jgi:hypothetical protein
MLQLTLDDHVMYNYPDIHHLSYLNFGSSIGQQHNDVGAHQILARYIIHVSLFTSSKP